MCLVLRSMFGSSTHYEQRTWTKSPRSVVNRAFNAFRAPMKSCESAVQMVGEGRFELPASCSQSRRATKLRHSPARAAYR